MSTIELKLRPFTVPNFVSVEMPAQPRQNGFKEAPSFALHELPPETLDRMCREFRVAVFAKAMKKEPTP